MLNKLSLLFLNFLHFSSSNFDGKKIRMKIIMHTQMFSKKVQLTSNVHYDIEKQGCTHVSNVVTLRCPSAINAGMLTRFVRSMTT